MKRLTGLVTALFCTLVVAWLCSYCFQMDFKWYNSLVKPSFMPNGAGFTLMVTITYISVIAVITRLVVGKHFFPSMFILGLTGIFSILFVYSFFKLKMIYLSAVFISLLFAASLVQLVRFFIKDHIMALMYLPAFAFNSFCVVIVFAVAMAN